MNDSIYLKAIEYSSKKTFEGVTFQELRGHIEDNFGTRFNAESLISFFKFILETHYWSSTQIGTNPTQKLPIINGFYLCFKNEFGSTRTDISAYEVSFKQFTVNEKYFINGEGDKRLLEFYELREARENAKQAYRFSIWAIVISLLALLASPLIEKLWNYIL